MSDKKSDRPAPRDTDKPSETAQKGLPEFGEGASAKGYLRDSEPNPAGLGNDNHADEERLKKKGK